MKFISRIQRFPAISRSGLLLLIAAAGCGRSEDIHVQRVPKDESPAPAARPAQLTPAPAANDFHAAAAGAASQIGWKTPANWQEKPATQMRAGSFAAQGGDGQTADVSIIPLPSGGPELELANLNIWRGELQLEPAGKADAAPVAVGAGQGKLFEIAGGQPPTRILVAVLDRDGTSWYFKMKGGDAVVQEQKPMFLEFLKSVSFDAAAAPAVAAADPHAGLNLNNAPAAAPATGSHQPVQWKVPAGWQELPGSEFLFAKFAIAGDGDARADVNVSMLAGEGGGMMPNLNRWRNQLGLPPMTSEEDYSKLVRTIETSERKGVLVDLSGTDGRTGKPARLIGIIVPLGGQTWFYKLMGDEALVEQQKATFLGFVDSAKYSNAP